MHVLTEHPLPGVDLRRIKQLSDAGVQSLEDLVAIGPDRLCELTGFDPKSCRTLVRVAKTALTQQNGTSGVIELVKASSEPSSARLTRGLTAARSVEHAVSVVRKVRTHTGRRPRKESWALVHAKARRQLRKLLARLQQLQQSVLSDGLSEPSHDHLTRELDALEQSFGPLLEEPVRKKLLKRVRRIARDTRRALDS